MTIRNSTMQWRPQYCVSAWDSRLIETGVFVISFVKRFVYIFSMLSVYYYVHPPSCNNIAGMLLLTLPLHQHYDPQGAQQYP